MDLPKIVKRLAWFCLALIGLSAAYFVRQIPRSHTPFAGKTKSVEHVVLRQGNHAVDLYRESGAWQVSASPGRRFAADAGKVKTLLDGLGGVQVEDEISNRADRWVDFDVAPGSATQVGLYGKNDQKLAEGFFGKQAPDFDHIYFRYPDRPAVFLARGLIRGELGGTQLGDWRRHELVSIPEAEMNRVTIRGPGFETELLRSSDTWTLKGQPIDPAPVYALAGTLAHLTADNFVETSTPTYDSLTEAAVQVQGKNQTTDLRIGREDAALKRYPVSAGPEAGVAWVDEAKVKAVLLKPSAFKKK